MTRGGNVLFSGPLDRQEMYQYQLLGVQYGVYLPFLSVINVGIIHQANTSQYTRLYILNKILRVFKSLL